MKPKIRFDCPDWWERLQGGKTPISTQLVNEDYADVAVELFNKLRVPDIAGQPTFREVGGDWISDIIRVAFGSVDVENRSRPVEEILNLIPKKNAKQRMPPLSAWSRCKRTRYRISTGSFWD